MASIGFAEVGLGKTTEKEREAETTLSNCHQRLAGGTSEQSTEFINRAEASIDNRISTSLICLGPNSD